MENRTFEILPNICIGMCEDNLLNMHNVTNIININNSKQLTNNYGTLSITINDNDNNNNTNNDMMIDINFEIINKFIIEILKKNEKIAICENDIKYTMMIICYFMMVNLKMTLIDSITFFQRKTNIDIKSVPQILFYQLFTIYEKIEN